MKTPWEVHRTTVAQHDGERRWDYAYQFLLQWAMEDDADNCSAPLQHQEDRYGNRSLRSGLDKPPTTAPDD
jgi:hypothetical protein